MDKTDWLVRIESLFAGEVEELVVSKDDFLTVRTILVETERLGGVRGTAKHGGVTVYRLQEKQTEE